MHCYLLKIYTQNPLIGYFLAELDRRGKVRIHPPLIYELQPSNLKLFYCLQWLDKPKSDGKVEVPEWVICLIAGIKKARLWQLLKDCHEKGLIHDYALKKGNLTIYLASQYGILRSLGYSRLEAIRETNRIFNLEDLKREAIATQTYYGQRQSRLAVLRRYKGVERKIAKTLLVREPETMKEKLLSPLQDYQSTHGASKSGAFYSFKNLNKLYISKSVIPYGVSQKRTAQDAGCSVDTIQRHQTHLAKKQICQSRPELKNLAGFFAFELGDTLKINSKDYRSDINPNRLFRAGGQWWLAMTNLYFKATECRSAKMSSARKAYKSFCQTNSNQMPTINKCYSKI